MAKLGGWLCGALLLALGCSSTVTDTRASTDAATDAIAIDAADPAGDASQDADDARADDAADAPRPPTGSNPCAADRVVDLDRVGLSTEYGVGAVVDQTAAPEVQIDPVDGSCGRIYRPVVLRLRAPRDGRIFVISTDGAGRTDAAFVRRMGRCDASGAAFTCDDSEAYCAAHGVCGRLLGDVHTGEPIDVAVGVTTSDDRLLPPRFGRLAVTLAVLPALSLGAPCRPGAIGQDALCAEGLTCSAVGDPGWIARCVRRTATPGTCPSPTDRCGDGETCVRGLCVRLLPAGAL